MPQPVSLGNGLCYIALASLGSSFKEGGSCTVDTQVESVLPVSPLLLRIHSYLDHYLQGRWEEDPVYYLSESLSISLSVISLSWSVVSVSASPHVWLQPLVKLVLCLLVLPVADHDLRQYPTFPLLSFEPLWTR